MLLRLDFGEGRWLAVALSARDRGRRSDWAGAICQADRRGAEGVAHADIAALVAHVGRSLDARWADVRALCTSDRRRAAAVALLDTTAAGGLDPGPPLGSGPDDPLQAAASCLRAALRADRPGFEQAREGLERRHHLPDDVAVHLDEAGGDLEDTDATPDDVLRFRADDPATWVRGRIVMRSGEGFDTPVRAPRLYALICALLGGAHRVEGHRLSMRTVVQWPGHPEPETPAGSLPWHIDDPDPAMSLAGREVGLLVLVLLGDAEREDGATLLDPGSPQRLARQLAQGGPLDTADHLWGRSFLGPERSAAATGEAGDVWLVHPWMLHTPGVNRRGGLRLLANPGVFLRESMRFDGDGLSPVEAVAARGLARAEEPR